jgi:hypothetical protein
MRSLIDKAFLSMVLAVWTLSNNPAHDRKPLQINEYQKFTPVLEQVDLVKLKIDESSTRDSTRENNYNCASITKNLCANQPISLHKSEKDLPDKIITSKKVRGRLIEIISGDYFYAKVSTKYGEETFLLDSNEGCFLSKHPKEQLLIYYDVLDRYTPQASGYSRVNVIRNITARKTSLKKWRMTLAKNKLGECNN